MTAAALDIRCGDQVKGNLATCFQDKTSQPVGGCSLWQAEERSCGQGVVGTIPRDDNEKPGRAGLEGVRSVWAIAPTP